MSLAKLEEENDQTQPQIAGATPFDECWRDALPRVFAYCRRALRDEHAAADVVQRVAVRAWRGFGSFRGEAPFEAWAMKIARRELDRHFAARQRLDRHEVLVGGDELPMLEVAEHSTDVRPESTLEGDMATLIPLALRLEAITPEQGQVLLLRLAEGEPTWLEVGKAMNRTAADVAVLHWRAIDKLRVFLFLHCPERVGGRAAMERLLAAPTSARDRLTAREEEVFRHLVLGQRLDLRKSGWRSALNAACAKVARGLGK